MNVNNSLDYGETWCYQIGEPFLDEVPVSELKDFLPAPDLIVSQGRRHVMSMSNRAGSNVIEWTSVTHQLLKLWQEPPEE